MKSITILFGIIALMVVSCSEDFLTIPSQTALTTEVFFKTESDFVSAVNGTYAPLRTLINGTAANPFPVTGAIFMGDMHSDNARYILNPNYRATIDQENIADFILEPANLISTTKYRTAYQIIGRANQVLFYIDGVSFAEDSKNNLKGQALFLRAYSYFELVQYFGKVPLHLVPVSTLEETALPLSETDAIINQVITDLQQAITMLPEKSVQAAGRVTKGAAKVLLANVDMVKKDYAAAETLLKEVVASNEYALLPSYASVFNLSNKNSKESVFEIQFKQGTDGYRSSFSYNMLPIPLALDTVAKLLGVSDPNAITLSEGYDIPSPDLIESYESGDLRENATIGYIHTSDGGYYPYCKKYIHPHATLYNADDNWPVYRYSEVLLFLAEAINEQNRPAEALHYINDVIGSSTVSIRSRAGLGSITSSAQADVRDAIDHERRIELAFENKRWLDLVRTGKAQEVITSYGQRVIANPAKYYFPAGTHPVPAAFNSVPLTFPLPAAESLLSPYF